MGVKSLFCHKVKIILVTLNIGTDLNSSQNLSELQKSLIFTFSWENFYKEFRQNVTPVKLTHIISEITVKYSQRKYEWCPKMRNDFWCSILLIIFSNNEV